MTPAELKAIEASDLLSEIAGSVDARFDCNPEVRRLRVAINALPALIRLWEAAIVARHDGASHDVCASLYRPARGSCDCWKRDIETALRELREMKL